MRFRSGPLGLALLSIPLAAWAEPTVEPTGPLSLETAAALVLEWNPSLRDQAQEVVAADLRVRQSDTRPDLELGLEVENFGGSLPLAGHAETTVSLRRLIERGGVRAARIAAAEGARSVVALELEARQIELLAELSRRYVEALADEAHAALAEETVQTAEEIVQAVRRRVEAGASPTPELARAEVEAARAHLEREAVRRDRELSRLRLASLWGQASPRFTSVEGLLESTADVPPREATLAACSTSVGVHLLELEAQARELELALVRSETRRDFELEAGARHLAESDDVAFVAAISTPLLRGDRPAVAIQGAELSVTRARARVERLRTEQRLEVTEAYSAYDRAAARVTALQTAVIPGTQRALEEIEEGYRAGRFGSLDLLDARRTWAATRTERIEALRDLHRASLEIERLAGAIRPQGLPSGGER